jgi:enoyl-CoA hydratase/carnithine racemase
VSEERVRVDVGDDGVAAVTLTRGDKHNGLDYPMFEALNEALDALETDETVKVVLLSGEGPSFCAGLDFKAFNQGLDERVVAPVENSPANFAQRAAVGWRLLPVPVVAALQGACYGGGIQLALAADIRIAAPDTKLSIMEAKYGIIPDMGLSQVLPGLVRDDVARELVYTARIVEAQEAAELGLVTRISDSALDDARARATQIAAQRPGAMRSAKRLLAEISKLNAADGLALEEELQRALLSVPATAQG